VDVAEGPDVEVFLVINDPHRTFGVRVVSGRKLRLALPCISLRTGTV
jgi:hypothetical protein